jgi:hypothetical protein
MLLLMMRQLPQKSPLNDGVVGGVVKRPRLHKSLKKVESLKRDLPIHPETRSEGRCHGVPAVHLNR